MESVQEHAFVTVIGIKIRSLIMYRSLLKRVKDSKIRNIFETLAKEATQHLKSFLDMLQVHEEELGNILLSNNTQTDSCYSSLLNTIDGNISDKDALRIALNEEKKSIKRYTSVVDKIREPTLREAFFRVLIETDNHIKLISEEFLHILKKEERMLHHSEESSAGLFPAH